ncbi:ABC transporter permease [Salinibacter altiplanensis]|uniref:ABC transporter permease n=1 Tax=Salinibacter altiplanensis TaxID=1803181 RepID=UPI000C9F420A|nr:ABC transporter permease [Salinibacter altiplanensis]
MNGFETIREALQALRANKLRSALTLLGIVIGVFAVIAAVTAVDVIDQYFKSSIQGLGASTVSVERYDYGGGDGPGRYHPPITHDQVLRLKERVGTDLTISVSERFDGGVKAQSDRQETNPNVSLYGTDESFLANFGYEMQAGRPFVEQDVQSGRPVALLGAEVADVLFPATSPLGQQVQIGRVRLKVVGVLAEKAGLFRSPNTRVYAPLTHLFGAYGSGGRSMDDTRVRAAASSRLSAAEDEVRSQLRVIRQVAPGAPSTFNIESSDFLRSTFGEFTSTLTTGGALVGLISLLAAGVGIMNIMLVSVTERTKEIGIRKAVGAKWRNILGQFLLEAIVLCQIGGLIGIVLGGLGGNLAALYWDIRPSFPWMWAGIAVGGVTLLAIVFGGYPAYKAARLDPIESLRYE